MRLTCLLLMSIAAGAPAAAADTCHPLSETWFKVIEQRGTQRGIEIGLQNNTGKTLKIVHGAIALKDRLGGEIGTFRMPAYETTLDKSLIRSILPVGDFAAADMNYITATVCIVRLMYDDGTSVVE